MAKIKTRFICAECGHEEPKWYGRCPGCGTWNSLSEEINIKKTKSGCRQVVSQPIPITQVSDTSEERMITGIAELDRVLGVALYRVPSFLSGEIRGSANRPLPFRRLQL